MTVARKLKFRVTKKVIDLALQQDRGNCPVALTLRLDDSGDFGWVRVDSETLSFTSRSTELRYTYKTPLAVKRFIEAFDADRESVHAFSFVLDLDRPIKVRGKQYNPKSYDPSAKARRAQEGKRKKKGVSRNKRPLS